eukprot:1572398-Rhodomonas_salina.1
MSTATMGHPHDFGPDVNGFAHPEIYAGSQAAALQNFSMQPPNPHVFGPGVNGYAHPVMYFGSSPPQNFTGPGVNGYAHPKMWLFSASELHRRQGPEPSLRRGGIGFLGGFTIEGITTGTAGAIVPLRLSVQRDPRPNEDFTDSDLPCAPTLLLGSARLVQASGLLLGQD